MAEPLHGCWYLTFLKMTKDAVKETFCMSVGSVYEEEHFRDYFRCGLDGLVSGCCYLSRDNFGG